MPAPVIKYDLIHLHSRNASIDSDTVRKYLTDNKIAFIELKYPVEQMEAALTPLSTWFEDGNGGRVQFTDFPIIIYDAVLWEAEDNSDRYAKRSYSKTIAGLPADFISKADKSS
jgi:hypothetical protein